jgi:hypothetical protein
MPRRPTELDTIEGFLQAAARTIRDAQPGSLEVERMRTEIYDHVYKAIEICAHYAFTRGDSARVGIPSQPSSGGGAGGGAAPSLASDLDFLKEE